jgi:CheY-like chemotaxis protein
MTCPCFEMPPRGHPVPAGFWVIGEASSGREATELVTQHNADLVLLDVRTLDSTVSLPPD